MQPRNLIENYFTHLHNESVKLSPQYLLTKY